MKQVYELQKRSNLTSTSLIFDDHSSSVLTEFSVCIAKSQYLIDLKLYLKLFIRLTGAKSRLTSGQVM